MTHFLDLTPDTKFKTFSQRLASAVSSFCRHVDASELFRRRSRGPAQGSTQLATLLKAAVSRAVSHPTIPPPPGLMLPLDLIRQATSPSTIVDWTSKEPLSLQVMTIDARRLLSKDKTYLLVGLTGQIGQSLCEWMAKNGAGCICLTSRDPNISQS